MRPSEVSLLRRELVKVTTEYRNSQKKMAGLEAGLAKRIMLLYRRIKVRDHSSEKPGIGHLI